MRKIFLSALCLGAILMAGAQNRIDHRSRALLSNEAAIQSVSDYLHLKGVNSDTKKVNSIEMIIELNSGESTEGLEALGIEIGGVIGNYVIANVPISSLEALDYEPSVRSAQMSKVGRKLNDKARSTTVVDDVHAGTDLPKAYKGTGVIVGLYDGGLDPNHINFRKADDLSTSRVQAVWRYRSATSVSSYTTPAQIANFQTDDKQETHGTHVLGIIAGSFDSGKTNYRYQGMAPDAEIVISCGNESETAILGGVEKMIAFAEEAGKPCAINLSLGTNDGPHDGSDNFTKALNELASRAVITISSGNEAEDNIALQKTLTATDNQVKTFLMPSSYYLYGTNYQAYGYIDIYSDDSSPYTVQFVMTDSSGNVVYTLSSVNGSTKRVGNGGESNSYFTSAFSTASYASMTAGLDTNNNRYHVLLNLNLIKKTSNISYYPAIIITGNGGETYRLFSDAYTEFSSRNKAGWDSATPDGTINTWACGPNTIAVGSYNSRVSIGAPANQMSSFTSYGTLYDGRTLPDICAPGSVIRSSYSHYYTPNAMYGDAVRDTQTIDGVSYQWGDMSGTSMASPMMAGVAALWLEANPNLTPDDVRYIAKSTATVDTFVQNGIPTQWGAGKLNAYEGLKMALDYAGVESIIADGHSPILVNAIGNRQFEVYGTDETAMNVSLYNTNGMLVNSVTSNGDTVVLDASNVAPGVYIINVRGSHSTYTTKVAIR